MKTYQITVNGEVFEVTVTEAPTPQSGLTPPRAAAPQPVPLAAALIPPKPAAPPPIRPAAPPVAASGGKAVQTPMPGKVIAVKVAPGDVVKSGSLLMILEAMKMENDILAPTAGTVTAVNVKAGDSAGTGDVLVVIE